MFVKSLVLLVTLFAIPTLGKVKFTNIKCKALDSKLYVINKCELKVIRRDAVALDIFVEILQGPLDNITVAVTFWRKASGYRLFLYNKTTDFCEFMMNRKKYPLIKIIADMLKSSSNINHTCPYDNEVILHNMILTDEMFKMIPLPTGEYMFQLIVYVYNEAKSVVKAYFQQIE